MQGLTHLCERQPDGSLLDASQIWAALLLGITSASDVQEDSRILCFQDTQCTCCTHTLHSASSPADLRDQDRDKHQCCCKGQGERIIANELPNASCICGELKVEFWKLRS